MLAEHQAKNILIYFCLVYMSLVNMILKNTEHVCGSKYHFQLNLCVLSSSDGGTSVKKNPTITEYKALYDFFFFSI